MFAQYPGIHDSHQHTSVPGLSAFSLPSREKKMWRDGTKSVNTRWTSRLSVCTRRLFCGVIIEKSGHEEEFIEYWAGVNRFLIE